MNINLDFHITFNIYFTSILDHYEQHSRSALNFHLSLERILNISGILDAVRRLIMQITFLRR